MANIWDYPTNYSNGTAVDGVGKMFIKYPSYILNDYYSMGIILLIWVASFGLSMAFGAKRALLSASFISFIFSIYLVRFGNLNFIVPIILIFLTILGALGSKSGGGY